MDSRSLWNEWSEPFDLFVSYARKDNEAGMVSALVETIETDFAHFSPSVPLRVFFDKKSILDMQHWQDVLKKGLRQSKVMLAVPSEAYFTSDWCRREWEEYFLVEQARTYPGEALTPIFIVAPEELGRVVPASARDWWDDVTARNAVVEIHPYWPKGRAALQEQLVVERLRRLQGNIRERVEHGRVLARVPRDIRGRNPNFVGRKQELARLRDALVRFEMAGICAVNGVGGIGKSSVAREYAYLFRKEYLGGQFEIDLSTIDLIRGVQDHLVRIARDYLGAAIPPELPEAEQHARARAAFQQLPPGQTALLILDNLNEECTGLVGRRQREAGLPSAEKVHLLITTRAEPRSLGGMETVSLDTLPPADALDLLFRYRPFARNPEDAAYRKARTGADEPEALATTSPLADLDVAAGEEWKAALAIVNRLGRHTLAVTLVGAYLGSYPDVSYAQFARELATHGIGLALDAAGSDDKVRNLIQHPETLVGPLFERSVARLSPLALRTLEYAALLPPDLVPLAWLKQLVTQDAEMAEALKQKPFQPPPWEETLRTLDGMQYLIGQPYARMHRVVQEVVRRRMSEAELRRREQALLVFIEGRTDGTYSDPRDVACTEQFVRNWPDQSERLIGQTAMWLVDSLQDLGRLQSALDMARLAERVLHQAADADPPSAQKQRDLSISFERLGDVSVAAGDLAAARAYYEQGLAIRRKLADADPHSAEKQRDLSISFNKLGDVSRAAGDLAAARAYYEQGLAIRRKLADADPHSAQKQRDLGVSHIKLFDIENSLGNRPAAREQLAAYVASRGKLEAEGRLPSPKDRANLKHWRQQLAEWAD